MVLFCLDQVVLLKSGEDPAKKHVVAADLNLWQHIFSFNDPTADQSGPIRIDLWVFTVGGESSRQKPDVIGSVAGWA